MKIAILRTSVPFVRGGADQLGDVLARELTSRDHQVELVKLPIRSLTPNELAESMFAAGSLRMPSADLVIALTFPAYLVPHRTKVVWLQEDLRGTYEICRGEADELDNRLYSSVVDAVRKAEEKALSEAHALYCASSLMVEALAQINLDGKLLLPPPLATTGGRPDDAWATEPDRTLWAATIDRLLR